MSNVDLPIFVLSVALTCTLILTGKKINFLRISYLVNFFKSTALMNFFRAIKLALKLYLLNSHSPTKKLAFNLKHIVHRYVCIYNNKSNKCTYIRSTEPIFNGNFMLDRNFTYSHYEYSRWQPQTGSRVGTPCTLYGLLARRCVDYIGLNHHVYRLLSICHFDGAQP